jgi:hypothetical protein
MRSFFILLLIFPFALKSFSQLNQKYVERQDGAYVYCYHKNGKLSTEEFRNSSSQYMAQGYAKAFDNTGKEIYNQPTSRSGQLSSVIFTYYENGAVKSADYSSHPDGGIQWYKKTTYFDEAGNITGEFELSDDMHVTYFQLPDTAYLRLEKDREALEKKKQADELQRKRDQFVKDSSAFFISSKEQLEDGSTVEFIPHPINGTRQKIISKSGKVIQITTEYYVKSSGVQTIRRTYYKNGRIEEEFIYEAQIWHYRKYDKKGKLIEEKLNQSITRTQ